MAKLKDLVECSATAHSVIPAKWLAQIAKQLGDRAAQFALAKQCTQGRDAFAFYLRNVMTPRITLALLLATTLAFSQEPGPDAVDAPFDRLSRVETFAFGGVGITGAISQGEKDYKALLFRPNAMEVFERLLSVGNMQAKSYALEGIRTVNPKRFAKLAKAFRDTQGEVATQRGCIVMRESFQAILKRIDAGEYLTLR